MNSASCGGLAPLRQPASWALFFLCAFLAAATGGERVRASRGELTLPTYPWTAVKHPYFRGTDKVNIYPYPMLDFLSREKTNRTYRTVMLENEFLRITFLPELGGKIQEVKDKVTGHPMFYVNHVVKPGLIGQCGAWTSGGVEWNTGPQGHTVSAMQPVPVEILPPEKDGSQSVAIGETERIYGTRWTVVVTLRPGRSFIEERIRIYNPAETIRPYYFWNCTAMPNMPGFRFIYPMTLGCDHGAEKFFQWPIDNGKDLTRGTNYYDASSIFAWHCDQDFFGSYDDVADRGVVSYANHNQVPGKKAWTWGQGGFGRMHQMDLTDDDGPYNEVQTGPLLTQGEVGRLDPCEAVSWEEWWYPVHGIGGFTFANKNIAVNASRSGGSLHLRILGTGTWKGVDAMMAVNGGVPASGKGTFDVLPTRPANVEIRLDGPAESADRVHVELRQKRTTLAAFDVPLDLPARTRPEIKPEPHTAAQYAVRGWHDFLFARFPEAEAQFRKAIEEDNESVTAYTGMAFLHLDSDPLAAVAHAGKALDVDPGDGIARYALAVAQNRAGTNGMALESAWKAALSSETAIAARALVGKLLIKQGRFDEAVQALSGPGPWENDPLCQDRRALALHLLGRDQEAARVARQALLVEPLDIFARSVLWLANAEPKGFSVQIVQGNAPAFLDLLADYSPGGLDQPLVFSKLRNRFFDGEFARDPLCGFQPSVFPHRQEMLPTLTSALEANPSDGRAALSLGHLLAHSGRYAEARALWQKAADLGGEAVIANRALGMACLTLDNDPASAAKFLQKAHELDKADAIVARDFARVVFRLADKSESKDQKEQLVRQARDTLTTALEAGKSRSDFVALLGRAHNRLGEFDQTSRMLDSVRVTVWEGSHEVHDLFEEAHLELGKQHLAGGRNSEALREFNRSLEYPQNLATGKLENAREAHIHYLRGNVLAALGRKDEARSVWKLAADEPGSSDARKEEARLKARQALDDAEKP